MRACVRACVRACLEVCVCRCVSVTSHYYPCGNLNLFTESGVGTRLPYGDIRGIINCRVKTWFTLTLVRVRVRHVLVMVRISLQEMHISQCNVP